MSSIFEAMGMSLPYSSTMSNEDDEKVQSAKDSAKALMNLVTKNIKTRDILTRKAIENGITVCMAIGGSTNAILHLLAIAHSADLNLTIDDFETIRQKSPHLCDLKPSGRFVATDLHKAGGIPAVMKILLNENRLHGDCLTVT
jgi:dihydroxy-acid dehydratase